MSAKTTLIFNTKEKLRAEVVTVTIEDYMTYNCGYIYIPAINAKYVNTDLLQVHVGVTYSEYTADRKYFVIGFDCAHYGDRKHPKSIGYCKNELIHLSRQIAKMIRRKR